MTAPSAVPLLFSLTPYPLAQSLVAALACETGACEQRLFPDGESYLNVTLPVSGRHCLVVADLSYPNDKYLPLVFLLATLRELGAASVGLVAPYLCYMRQDTRFAEGEAVTSRIFAADLSRYIDWLVTVDPHLHRYRSLADIYSVPGVVVHGAPALVEWLQARRHLLLVGPDSESRQWVGDIAAISGHPFVVGSKQRRGDRDVTVTLPDLQHYRGREVVIVDDIIASGHTLLECIGALREQGVETIHCIAVHGVFTEGVYAALMKSGLSSLHTTNTIPHASNAIDVTSLLVPEIILCMANVSAKGVH